MDATTRPVFFSFSSKDRKIAQTICAALEARGFGCWLSTRDVKPGENYQIAIVHAINQAKVLLLIFSSNSNASDEIKKELSLASKRRLTVIPVRVEDVLPDEGMSYELATRQWIDLFAGWEAAMAQLAEQLGMVVGAASPAAVTPPEAAGQNNGAAAVASMLTRYWKRTAIAAIVLVVIAGAAFYGYTRHAAVPPAGVAAVPNSAATEALLRCMKADPDQAIKGCTQDLALPGFAAPARASFLKFRGAAHVGKFEYDLAIADYTSALAITPRDGSLYFLRATVLRVKGDQAGADADAARAKALGYTPPWQH
jgi:hypothetical protein